MMIGRRFIALKTFEFEPIGSTYCEGLTYTIRTEQLAKYAADWEAEGLIRYLEPIEVSKSMVAGQGFIS